MKEDVELLKYTVKHSHYFAQILAKNDWHIGQVGKILEEKKKHTVAMDPRSTCNERGRRTPQIYLQT